MKALALAALHVSTVQVNDLHVENDLMYAATSGGVEVYSVDGERLYHWTEGLPAQVTAVGRHEGRLTVGVEGGARSWDPLPVGGGWAVLAEEEVPGWAHPRDLEDRIQVQLAALQTDARHVNFPANALAPLGDELAVGTSEGLFLVGEDGPRLITPQGQICGSFLTGATRWLGRIVVSTFDRGACILEDDAWRRIEGLPTEMLNDVQADGDVVGPVSVDHRGAWRRHRLAVWGRSYQDIAACGREAWVASEDAGVSWTDGRRWEHFDASTGLPDDWIMAVACDGEAAAWAGTYQDGVWEMRGGRFQKLKGLSDDWILALGWGEDALWVGTMGGLFVHDQGFRRIHGIPHPAVHDLTVDQGEVLVSTEGGLAVLELS